MKIPYKKKEFGAYIFKSLFQIGPNKLNTYFLAFNLGLFPVLFFQTTDSLLLEKLRISFENSIV